MDYTYSGKNWKSVLIDFLSSHWHLIDNLNIGTLYNLRPLDNPNFSSSALTEYLLEAGINPLDYMIHIPKYYLEYDAHLPTIIIPNNIEGIQTDAFFNCNSIETIKLNQGCKYIQTGAFQLCGKLRAVYIPATVSNISNMAFVDCEDYLTIYAPKDSYAITYAIEHDFKYHEMTDEECIRIWGKVN